jgi:hypothetical protein
VAERLKPAATTAESPANRAGLYLQTARRNRRSAFVATIPFSGFRLTPVTRQAVAYASRAAHALSG